MTQMPTDTESPVRFQTKAAIVAAPAPSWGDAPTSQPPGWIYTDEALYEREMEQLFYKGHWCYVGLECEVPKAGETLKVLKPFSGQRSCPTTTPTASAMCAAPR